MVVTSPSTFSYVNVTSKFNIIKKDREYGLFISINLEKQNNLHMQTILNTALFR